MKNIKKGNIVTRKSYNKDILFITKDIFRNIALLDGLTVRITADSPIEDLEVVTREDIIKEKKKFEDKFKKRINKEIKENIRYKTETYTGSILHLDGDKKYTEKSYRFYKKMNLNAVVKYIPEKEQPIYIKKLLNKYKPDILVITRS